ncbi:MAG: 16S rRNA processing protein RimM [Leptolinea sp.]|nr:16S rRNA processing protein RimM [Leptolinea sp.]
MKTRHINRRKIPGSPESGEPEYVLIGRLQRTHGVTGEMVLGIMTDFPERIIPGKLVYLGASYIPHKITGTRPFHNNLLVTLEGVHTCEEAAKFTNLQVFVRTRDLPELEEGRFYHHQLIGLTVRDEGGAILGSVKDIIVTGANDVYVVNNPEGEEILLPAVETVILKVDLEERNIVVRPPMWE